MTVNMKSIWRPGCPVPVAVSGDEQTLLTFTAVATDGDLPANQFTFSLQGTVPTGAEYRSGHGGVFSWTPTSARPGAYDITVRVTDNGTPNAFIEQTVRLTIRDANQSPLLPALGGRCTGKPDVDHDGHRIRCRYSSSTAHLQRHRRCGCCGVRLHERGALSFVTAPNFETPRMRITTMFMK